MNPPSPTGGTLVASSPPGGTCHTLPMTFRFIGVKFHEILGAGLTLNGYRSGGAAELILCVR